MRTILRICLTATLVVSSAVLVSSPAAARTSKAVYDFHAGDGFGPLTEPDVAMADNGDTITLTATGVLDAGAKTASGSGTLQHRNAAGDLLATGTFTITGLTAFQFYGCGVAGGQPIPPNLCGGRALLPVHAVAHPVSGGTEEADAVLQVTCVLGYPPAGAREGIRFNVKDFINFNKSVEGETVLVAH